MPAGAKTFLRCVLYESRRLVHISGVDSDGVVFAHTASPFESTQETGDYVSRVLNAVILNNNWSEERKGVYSNTAIFRAK